MWQRKNSCSDGEGRSYSNILDFDEFMLNKLAKKAEEMKNINWRKADVVLDDWGKGFDAGFNIQNEYGDYKGASIGENTSRAIIWAKKHN